MTDLIMGGRRLIQSGYTCPECGSPLHYDSEGTDVIRLRCEKCKHLVMARK